MPRLPIQISRARVQIAAALLAAVFAYQGAAAFAHQGFTRFEPYRFYQSRANFDETAGWLGLALLCLAVVAWDGARPHPTTWPARLAAFLRRRWWELALVLSLVGFAAFMFTFRFGEFPPSDLICCEEEIRAEDGYAVLKGGRPLIYPLSRYSTAFGFLLFGENTLGLRFPLILAGVLMVPVFYLLLRELVRVPVALFATALLASSWPLFATEPGGAQPSYLANVLFALLLVLGIRRRNALALLGAGFLAGVLSYEHESYKAVPIVAGGFLTALVVYRLAYPLPKGASAFLARLWPLVRTNWRPAMVFVGAALIVVTPLLVTVLQGQNLYFPRLEAHVSGEVSGAPGITSGLLGSNWEEQLGWAAEFFLPFGPQTFDRTYIATARLVDPITGTLLALGVILGVVTFWRPFRLLFLAWYLGVLGAEAALTEVRFFAWKFFFLLPAGLVLAAFVADDVGRVVGRWARGPAVYLFPVLLLGSALFVAYWNANTLFGSVANDTFLLKEYDRREGMQYALCDYLRGRGDENFSYTHNGLAPTQGFARPHETLEEQREAWGSLNLLWVCHDLRGQALASPAEVWPMRDIPAGPLTWAFVIDSAGNDELVESLGRAIPSKTEPDRIIAGAAGTPNVVAYELSGQELTANQGLFGEYRSGEEGTLLAERVDDVRSVLWDAQSGLSPPFTVQWRGLIYVPKASTAALTARTSDPTLITVDGQVSYSSQGESPASFPRDLLPGWHPVEILLHKVTPGGSFALQWVGPEDRASSVARQDLAALSSLAGWTHERTLESGGELMRTQRFDFAPYFSSSGVVHQELSRSQGRLATVTDEQWSAVWHVREGREYQLKLQLLSGSASVMLDGAAVLTLEAPETTAEAVASVSAGDHRLEIEQRHDGGAWTGAILHISDTDDPTFVPDLSPF